jgi:N-methylhydantoinase A
VAGVRVGIDIGGTFTDAVCVDRARRLSIAKVRTEPEDLAGGFVAAVDALGVDPGAISYLVHGSTIAANALVQGRTARIGLLTTAGFRDVLEIGTQQRPVLYDLHCSKADPLVPRELRREVGERIGAEGQVLEPLTRADVEAAAHAFRDADVQAIAVCFLFSFANSAHEREAGRILEALLPGVPIALSCEVAPERREYPRAATTALNAALLPVVGSYVEELDDRLAGLGARVPLHLMRSNGGLATAGVARRLPVALIASGPAAGVIAAARLGSAAGMRDLLTFDMGGTTADVCLVSGGEPERRFRGEVQGHPVTLPQIDVLSVGAGGGSIGRVDAFGSLRVGPESAGADPGPAAYGRGGEDATVSDAHLVLGTLDPDRFLGGRMTLDAGAARRAVERTIAKPLGLSRAEAARAIVRIADATMARALHVISVGRGHDPRGAALVAFGGAGPMHGCSLAEELGMRRVLVPAHPGVTSALGLLLADVVHDLAQTWLQPVARVKARDLRSRLAALERQGRDLLAASGQGNGRGRVELALDLRYRGQAYDLTVPLRGSGSDALRAAEHEFHAAHERAYGHALPVEETEIVTLRARAVAKAAAPAWDGAGGKARARKRGERDVWRGSRRERYALYEREDLGQGARVSGPAIVEQDDSTIVVPPGWRLSSAAAGTALLERGRR